MTYIHKCPEHPEEWWKSSEYIGVETWDVPKIVAESRRRTLAEVREMVGKMMLKMFYDESSEIGKYTLQVGEYFLKLFKDFILSKLDEMK